VEEEEEEEEDAVHMVMIIIPTTMSPLPPQVLQGQNLVFTRAGNKGAVSLPILFHGVSLAVIAAHLPADSRESRLERRNHAVEEIFRTVSHSGEPFDAQLQHHHTVSVLTAGEGGAAGGLGAS
jgi:hypothetical protein